MKVKKFCALILAAGKGTRMKSDLAKVLHVLEGKPLLHYSIEAARRAGAGKIVVIIGHQAQKVREEFPIADASLWSRNRNWEQGMPFYRQRMCWLTYQGLTVILCGDVPC